MTWNPIDEPVDFVILAGVRSPGIAEVTGWTRNRRWDERRGYALSGATLVYRGNALARGKITFRLMTVEQWEAWNTEFAPLLARAPAGERARALDVTHPLLEQLDVRSVVVENDVQPTQTDDGVWSIEVALIEFRRPVPALGLPAGSDTRPVPGNGTPEQQIQNLDQAIARELAAG